jgi:hypothetical protein
MIQVLELNKLKPHSPIRTMWLSVFFGLLIISASCKKEESSDKITLFIKTGVNYTADGAKVPIGGKINIGIIASGVDVALTYLRVEKITLYDTLTAVDVGMYKGKEGCDTTLFFSKDTNAYEIWKITVMNADRIRISKSIKILRGSGSGYGEISYFPSVVLGLQGNSSMNHYLDIDKGLVYNAGNVGGHEGEVDMLCYYYVTSGLPSPTFICPGYPTVIGYYPELNSWPVRNNTVYDYKSSDNDLVSPDLFDAALNDSLLVNSYNDDKVSGNCKYCYTGKIVPFKTQAGKVGLIKVIRADETETGSLELAIKVQK